MGYECFQIGSFGGFKKTRYPMAGNVALVWHG